MTAKQSRRNRRRSARGFSLIEVLIASVVFLLAVAGATTSMRTAGQQFRNQRHLTMGLQIAEAVTEELLLHFQSSPAIDAGVHTQQFDAEGNRSAALSDAYLATWTVTPANPIDALRRIDVVVTWSLDGTPHSVKLFTYRP